MQDYIYGHYNDNCTLSYLSAGGLVDGEIYFSEVAAAELAHDAVVLHCTW